MEWTAELDAQLTELFKRRLGIRFISSWTRWPAPAIRTRLVELGLTQPLQRRTGGSAGESPAASAKIAVRQPIRHLREMTETEDAAASEDEDSDFRAVRGKPRGWLVSEAQVAQLYREAGRDYR